MRKLKLLIVHLIFLTSLGYAQTVTIDKQVWSTKNLDVTTFRNGDPIPQAKTDEEWKKAYENKQPAWCYYDNDLTNGTKYGKLYNWYAVNDPRGLAPKGWHIPTEEDWTTLTNNLDESVAGKKMKSKDGWKDGDNGTNESGFGGLPGGQRLNYGAFYNIGNSGYWWSSTENNTTPLCLDTFDFVSFVSRNFFNRGLGLSVRCIRD